jgi:hypothetical protein
MLVYVQFKVIFSKIEVWEIFISRGKKVSKFGDRDASRRLRNIGLEQSFSTGGPRPSGRPQDFFVQVQDKYLTKIG